MFLRAIEKGRLSHAYALVGEEQIGKTTFALDLAKVLGADPVFDIYLFDSEEGSPIEEARNLRARLNLTPVGRTKVAIVAYAEKMTVAAANSLLKILEEPPARSVLILVTANFYALLPTIASRVQRINFTRALDREVGESLSKLGLEEGKLLEIIKLAGGRIGLAQQLALDSKMFEFFEASREYYQILKNGTILERLQKSEKLAELEAAGIEKFLKFAMRAWVENATELRVAEKLQTALQDLKYNLNMKLVLDNLFLP